MERHYTYKFKYKAYGKTSTLSIKLSGNDLACLAQDGYVFYDSTNDLFYIYLVDLRDYMTTPQLMKTASARLCDEDKPVIKAYCKDLFHNLKIIRGELYYNTRIKPCIL